MSYKLIISIVPQYDGELVTNAARDAGSPGGTVLMATETSANGIIQLLGFGDSPKDITFNIVEESCYKQISDAIINSTCNKKNNYGILFSINVENFIKAGNQDKTCSKESKGEKSMSASNFEMINVIVNKGYAEDAMAAARKAGAGGGTIIAARGTAKEGDAKFFGAEIVPEKDMLIILVTQDKKQDILNAITGLECFQKAGSGIVFCNQVQDFTVLGKKA